MVERIGQLLDDAVDDVVPREVDPVAAVLRRVRTARTRRVAGGSVVAGLTVVAVIATGMLWTGRDDPPERLASPATGPAVVTVTDGVVHAGGLHMPVPTGWKVAAAGQPLCSGDTRLVVVDGSAPPLDGCPHSLSRISVYGAPPQNNAIVRAGGTRELRLPGGQPAWVSRVDIEALRTGPETEFASLTVAVPWSGVRLVFAMPRGELTRILGTVRTDPIAATKLVLPAGVAMAQVDAQVQPKARGLRMLRPADEIMTGLAGLASPVGSGGCAEDADLDTVELTDAAGQLLAVVTVGCGQATSSLGGRVRVDDGFLAAEFSR